MTIKLHLGERFVRSHAPAIAAALLAAMPVGSAWAQNLFFGSIGIQATHLYTTDLDGLGLSDIFPGSGYVAGVAADGAQQTVFWMDHISGGQLSIHSATFSGASHSVLATGGYVGNSYGVAVDRVNQRVYWTDATGIRAVSYNGTGNTPIVPAPYANDVEVDPVAGKMFWIDTLGVYTAALNGANPQTLVTLPGNSTAFGLTIDPGTQTLFWSDWGAGTISSIPYAGGTPSTILSGHQFVAGLEFEPTTNRLYVVNKGLANVAWMPPTGGTLTTVFSGSGPTLGEMWDVAAVVPAPGCCGLLMLGGVIAARRRPARA